MEGGGEITKPSDIYSFSPHLNNQSAVISTPKNRVGESPDPLATSLVALELVRRTLSTEPIPGKMFGGILSQILNFAPGRIRKDDKAISYGSRPHLEC